MWGSFGDIIFQGVLTPEREDFKRKSSFNFASVNTLVKPKLQFLGENLDEIEFKIILVKYGDFKPVDFLNKLREMAKSGKAYKLIVGDYVKGDFVIKNIEETLRTTDSKGNVISIELKLKLKEFN